MCYTTDGTTNTALAATLGQGTDYQGVLSGLATGTTEPVSFLQRAATAVTPGAPTAAPAEQRFTQAERYPDDVNLKTGTRSGGGGGPGGSGTDGAAAMTLAGVLQNMGKSVLLGS